MKFLFVAIVLLSPLCLDAQQVPMTFFRFQNQDCPVGYIPVPLDPNYATADTYTSAVTKFCVAKYEASDSGDGVTASSRAGASPWTSLTLQAAKNACAANGPNFKLINLGQWQTIARNIESVAWNWQSGAPGVNGTISSGHEDGAPNNALPASLDDNDACSGTGQSCDGSTWSRQRRTMKLTNGSIIWDFAGNVEEFVFEVSALSKDNSFYLAMYPMPGTMAYHTTYGTLTVYNTNAGMGVWDWNETSTYTNAVARGGWWNMSVADGAGLYSTDTNFSTTTTKNYRGFRCVYVFP